MREENWQQVQEAFNHAVGLKERERNDYLKRIETESREIYNEVASLLSADDLADVLPNSRADFDFVSGEHFWSADTQDMDIYATNVENSPIGETIGGRYEVIKKLGSGGMGDVFLAHDRNVMNRETVVKLLKIETLDNKEVLRKFKQEIEALARLKDPHIVTILDSGTFGKQPFIVLEYVEGEDLALIISPVLFSRRDFLTPSNLKLKLLRGETKINRYFREKFSPGARAILSGDIAKSEISDLLRDEFNSLLSDENLFDADVFSDLAAAPPTQAVGSWESQTDLFNANRDLIESSFPEEFARGADKKLSNATAAAVFRQAGASLTHGHNKGIIHRDLKPANIMVTENERGEWQTKLIDFGVAKVKESLVSPSTEIGISFGTRKYMSPEHIDGKVKLTPAADIYALGLIAFESLTGRHVFRTDSFIEQCRLQEQEDFSEITEISTDLSPEVKKIICRALSFKPENRQTTAAEFGDSLADALLLPQGKPDRNNDHTLDTMKQSEVKTEVLDESSKFEIKDLKLDSPKVRNKKILPVAAGIFAVLLLFGIGGWLVWRTAAGKPAISESKTDTAAPAPAETVQRELNYKLIVQKYYQGKPFQEPFEATGDEIFGDDWRFRMALDSAQAGNLYLLSENPQTKNLTMLFPHPQRNGGISSIKAGEKIETGEMAFDKNQGTEKFWIIWSENPVEELEAVKSFVNQKDLGKIKDAEKEKAVRDFLDKTNAQEKLIEKTADDKQSKNIKTSNDILVKLAEFRHN